MKLDLLDQEIKSLKWRISYHEKELEKLRETLEVFERERDKCLAQ